jgi:hypothetical protein
MIDVHGLACHRSVRLVSDGEVVRVESTGSKGAYVIAIQCERPITEIEAISQTADSPYDLNFT